MFGKKSDSEKAAIETHRKAKEELERVSKRDKYESDAYLAANQAVIDAEADVSWWRR